MFKLLFHRETLELLGIHCFGEQASEIVHIGQAIMPKTGKANSIKYFVNATFNYPTMAEGILCCCAKWLESNRLIKTTAQITAISVY